MWNIRFPGEEEWDFCLEYLKENGASPFPKEGERVFALCEEEGKLLAAGELVIEEGSAWVACASGVSADYQGILMDALAREAENRGAKTLLAWARSNDPERMILYRDRGFLMEEGEEPRDWLLFSAALGAGQGNWIASRYFWSRAALIAGGVLLFAAMLLGPLQYTSLSVAFGIIASALSLAGILLGFASWEEEDVCEP